MTQTESLDLVQNIMNQLGVKTTVKPSEQTSERDGVFYSRKAAEYGITSYITVDLDSYNTFFGVAQDGRIFAGCNFMINSPLHLELFENHSDNEEFIDLREDDMFFYGENFWQYIENSEDEEDMFFLTTPESFKAYYEGLATLHGLRPEIIHEFEPAWGGKELVGVKFLRYIDNHSLACVLKCRISEDDLFFSENYAMATVNLWPIAPKEPDRQYIDENNLEGIGAWLQKHGIAEPTGKVGHSGYCTYPEYKFKVDEKTLKKLDEMYKDK